jgi:hypothetical protein
MATLMLKLRKTSGVVAVASSAIKTMGPLQDGGTDLELVNGRHIAVCEAVPQIKAMIAVPFIPSTRKPKGPDRAP